MNITRILRLIRCDLFINKSVIMISAITLAAVLFLLNIIFSSNIESVNEAPTLYYLVLYIGGLWMASLAFRDIHDRKQAYMLLTLPCSTFEKFFSRWFLTSIGFSVGLLVVYTMIYWLIALFSALVFSQSIVLFDPLKMSILKNIIHYVILQSMFLLGSMYFKKHTSIKTILTMTIISISINVLIMIMSFFALHPLFSPSHIIIPDFSSINFPSVSGVFYLLFWIFIPIICWSVTYQRFKECEDK